MIPFDPSSITAHARRALLVRDIVIAVAIIAAILAAAAAVSFLFD